MKLVTDFPRSTAKWIPADLEGYLTPMGLALYDRANECHVLIPSRQRGMPDQRNEAVRQLRAHAEHMAKKVV